MNMFQKESIKNMIADALYGTYVIYLSFTDTCNYEAELESFVNIIDVNIKKYCKNKYTLFSVSDCRQNAFGQHSRSVFLVFGSKSVYLINNKHFWVPLFPFLAIIFASFFRFMQANVSPTFISIRAFPIICV